MKNSAVRIMPLAALTILLISEAPLAYASTLTVNLNPTTGVARVDSTSTTKIVFTYPAGSAMSRYLQNVSSSYNMSGSFEGGTSGLQSLQGSFHDHDSSSRVSVQNASVSIGYTAKGNATALVIDKVTNVTAWVSGVFKVVTGSVVADLGWRSFVVMGPMDFDMGGHSVDINLVGSTMENSLASHIMVSGFLLGAFGGESIWNRPTLNFSALNAPLSTWTKNYDASTNTTTFTKTISGQSTFTSSLDINCQKYSNSATSDPSGAVTVQGYANASGDSLVLASAPTSTSAGLIAVGVVIVAFAALGGYLAIKRGARPKTPLVH